jgi:hypothetical protein
MRTILKIAVFSRRGQVSAEGAKLFWGVVVILDRAERKGEFRMANDEFQLERRVRLGKVAVFEKRMRTHIVDSRSDWAGRHFDGLCEAWASEWVAGARGFSILKWIRKVGKSQVVGGWVFAN